MDKKDKENIMSLKDFDTNSMYVVNRARQKQTVMAKNLKASQLIIAAKKIKREKEEADIEEAHGELRNMVKENKLPDEAYIINYDNRIKTIGDRVKMLSELRDAQDGFLKEGQEKALADLSVALDQLKEEKIEFLAKLEARKKSAALIEKESAAIQKAEAKLEAGTPSIVKAAPASADKEALLEKAKELGIDAKGTWGVKKLEAAIAEKGAE